MNSVLSYALALRIMLANLRRKVGTPTPAPTIPPPSFVQEMIVSPTFVDPEMSAPFTMEELGFCWPSDQGIFSPSAVPVWLREQVGCSASLLFMSLTHWPYRAWQTLVCPSMEPMVSSSR